MSEAPAKGGLSAPLRNYLKSPLSEAAVGRIWRGVGERRARAGPQAAPFPGAQSASLTMGLQAAPNPRAQERASRPRLRLGAVAMVLVGAALLLVLVLFT